MRNYMVFWTPLAPRPRSEAQRNVQNTCTPDMVWAVRRLPALPNVTLADWFMLQFPLTMVVSPENTAVAFVRFHRTSCVKTKKHAQ